MVAPLKPNALPFPELTNARVGGTGALSGSSGSSGISGISGTSAVDAVSGEGLSSKFTEKLREALSEANATQVKAETAAQDYANGKQNDLHGTMITMAEADVQLRLVSNVRNRAIEAYREIMRMGS